jgi:hypothetical protein
LQDALKLMQIRHEGHNIAMCIEMVPW